MLLIKKLFARLRGLVSREAVLEDISEELRLHIEMETETLMQKGMTADQARATALRNFGNMGRIKDQGYDIRGGGIMDTLWQDLRYGFRWFTRNPTFTAIAVLTIALGIGINSAIFSVVDGVLLRPLPYQNSDRLVRIWSANEKMGQRFLESSYSEFIRFKNESRAFVAMAAFSEATRILRDDTAEPGHISIARISDGLFSVLQISPVLGRVFLPEEFNRGERAVILSYRLWENRYAANRNILGKGILVDGEPHTIVGIMPQKHGFPATADLWRPLTDEEKEDDDPELLIVSRLKPGVTLEQSESEVRAIAQRIARSDTDDAHRTAWVQSMQGMVVRYVRLPLFVLMGVVALVLMIACANVANLMLARFLSRQQEIAIRTALGAGRKRIVRQLLTESLLIAILGGVLGLLLGSWALRIVVLLTNDFIPRMNEVNLDLRVIAVMGAVSTLAGIFFGLVPALQTTQLDLQSVLKRSGSSAGMRISRHRLRQTLVIAEVALATVLVISAGLLMKSFARLVNFDHGFRARNVLVVPLNFRGQGDSDFEIFYDQVLQQVRSLSGVQSASLALHTPLEAQGFRFPFRIEGDSNLASSDLPSAVIHPVTHEYFKTVGIPIVSGRTFSDQDGKRNAVAILNHTFAKILFSRKAAVGRRLQSELLEGQSITIVGVVADVTPEAGAPAIPAIYFPFDLVPMRDMSLLLRATNNPVDLIPAVRTQIWSLNPNMPLDKIYTLQERATASITVPRLTMFVVGLFAALGMALALVGIYGVMSYAVTERTKEIGIRRALGAQKAEILLGTLRQGARLMLLGLALGLVIAIMATRLIAALLFGVSTTDPVTFAGVSSLLVAVGLVACYIAARQAVKVDPLTALRHQ